MTIDVVSLFDRRANNRWNRTSVGDILERQAIVSPESEALVAISGAYGSADFSRLTYQAADTAANRCANALSSRGIGRGDRILLVCENSAEAIVAKIAIAKLGAVVVPVNPGQTVEVFAHAVALTRPSLVIADAEHGVLPAAVGMAVDVTIPIGNPTGNQGKAFWDFCSAFEGTAPEVPVHGDDIWQILMTSGTTAMPKGVMISHSQSYFTALSYAVPHTRGLRHETHLRTVCFSPIIFHVGDQAYAMPALFTGGTVILGRRYRPPLIAAAIASERATTVIAGGVQLAERLVEEMLALGPDAMSSVSVFQSGLGMLSPKTTELLEDLCPGVSLLYISGQTESCGGHRFSADVFNEKYLDVVARGENLVGKPTPLMSSQIVDPENGSSPLPAGKTGELAYRSPIMMAGYYRDAEATKSAFADGWFHSGDLGKSDPDGQRFIVGRIKDVIKTGGENVSGPRVEGVLVQHPSVAQVAVIGLSDPVWGEAVTGVVVAAPGNEVIEAELIAFCRQNLAGYEVPKRIMVVDELPLDFSGKVRKFALREMLG